MTEPKFSARQKRQVATLEEVARRAIRDGTPTAQAIAAVRRVSADAGLLAVAAARARGRWAAIPLFHSIGQEVAELLMEAGADPGAYATTAASIERRLRRHVRRG